MKCINVDLKAKRVTIGVGKVQVDVDSAEARRWINKSKTRAFQVQLLGSDIGLFYFRTGQVLSSADILEQVSSMWKGRFE